MADAAAKPVEPAAAAAPGRDLRGLTLAALGVVFGDIGTSPIYTFRECLNPERHLPLSPEKVLAIGAAGANLTPV